MINSVEHCGVHCILLCAVFMLMFMRCLCYDIVLCCLVAYCGLCCIMFRFWLGFCLWVLIWCGVGCLGCLAELGCWWFGFVCLLFVCLMVFGADVCFGIIC